MTFTVIRSVIVTLCCVAAGLNLAGLLQENRYQVQTLRDRVKFSDPWVRIQILIAVTALAVDLFLPMLMIAVIQVEELRTTLCEWIVLVLFVIATVIECILSRDTENEIEIRITRRFVRLIIADAVLLGASCAILQFLSTALSPYCMFAFSSFFVWITAVVMRPVEDFLCTRYFKAARKKIEERKKKLITIGIVGTYGKTEVKMILNTLLSRRYRVLVTPPNFSSAMGIARTINEQLTDKHNIFIAEMGAVQKGEIREMTRMIRPTYGILTCISMDKKNTFRSPESAAQSMNELLARIPKNGLAVFGSDGGYSDRMYALYKGNKRNAGALSERDCYMQAQNIDTGVHGTRFELVCRDGRHMWTETALLGMYSIRNIAIAATIASELGITMEEIDKGIRSLQPVKHHLQLKVGSINVIDDSLNGNPESAAESLKVLAEFPGRRVLVTAGFASAEDDGYGFGTNVAGKCDYVVLVGTGHTRGIVSALSDSDFPKTSVKTVRSETDAVALLKDIISVGDTVLYEGIYPKKDSE